MSMGGGGAGGAASNIVLHHGSTIPRPYTMVGVLYWWLAILFGGMCLHGSILAGGVAFGSTCRGR